MQKDELIQTLLNWQAQRYERECVGCDSPIEELLAIALYDSFINFPFYDTGRLIHVEVFDRQGEIQSRDRKYRVDFEVVVTFGKPFKNSVAKKYVIECDGHDFHEKTKEQVISDNERTRALQRLGYTVVRFSGSEIFNDPLRCADSFTSQVFSDYFELNEVQKWHM